MGADLNQAVQDWGILGAVLAAMYIVGMWKVYAKAGKPGIAALIPIWAEIVWLQIIGRPLWWLILMIIPGVNVVVYVIISLDLAKAYGKGAGFGWGLVFFPMLFAIMLGWGSAQYTGIRRA